MGTPGYTAPEILTGETSYDGEKADVWSLGVILFLLVFGRHPFYDERDSCDSNFTKTSKRIREGKFEYPTTFVSPGLKNLLSRIFVVDPHKRIAMSEIFHHPWYKKGLPKEALEINEACKQNGFQIDQTKVQLNKILEAASLS